MKRIVETKTVEYPNIVWVAYVPKQEISVVMQQLVQNPDFFGALVENDMGGSGGWRITFHKDHDRPDIVELLGRYAAYVDLFEQDMS